MQALRPEPLEHSHLPDAITDMANGWSQTCAVTWTVEITGTPQPLITSIEVTLFRVGQEALANVAKHAKASMVGLTLSYLDDVVLLDARDDGVGFDVHSPNRSGRPAHGNGFGLQTMRQRLRGSAGHDGW